MFKVGDIVKTKYESGEGSFRIVEILNETHILVKPLDEEFDFTFAVKQKDWDLDKTQYRKNKVIKILNKLKT